MKNAIRWTLYVAVGSLVASSCAPGDGDGVSVIQEALNNGQSQGGFLRFLTFTQTSEDARQRETCTNLAPPCGTTGSSYYSKVGIATDGSTAAGTIASALPTLDAFTSRYFVGNSSRVVTYYYNRGDLGIGREMHCIDRMNEFEGFHLRGEIACYVTNFAAGDFPSEFTFGLSSNIAFANLEAHIPFATVAMVYRDRMAVDSPNRVFFVVYDANGNLSPFAALDRHGIEFNNAFQATKPNNPDVKFGTPGSTFNNHIPSNCIACHGGRFYDSTGHTQTASLFLPFDLDQFEYETVSPKTRGEQEPAFKLQNQMVRKVAALSVSATNVAGTSVKNQLDTWYNNTSFQGDRAEVFENNFNGNLVISGWVGFEGVYQAVVRPMCRDCHMNNQLGTTFDTETNFRNKADASAGFMCSNTNTMPHSLQTLRNFWQSNAPQILVDYFENPSVGKHPAAEALKLCGPTGYNVVAAPGDIATLDPPALMTSVATAVF